MFQIMPALSAADYEALKADIAARGVQVPIEYDEQGNIIDGHHRVRACEELGIRNWPKIVRPYADDAAKRTQARSLNIARRHLNARQKREIIAMQLTDTPDATDRKIAEELGVSHHTVAAVRAEDANGQIAHNDSIPNEEKPPTDSERREKDGRKARGRKPVNGVPLKVPPGMNVEGLIRIGIERERNGESPPTVARALGMATASYCRGREIVLLADNPDLSPTDRTLAETALQTMNEDKQASAAYHLICGLAQRVFGKRTWRIRGGTGSFEKFDLAMITVGQTCESAATMAIPYLSADRRQAALTVIQDAIKHLKMLSNLIKEKS